MRNSKKNIIHNQKGTCCEYKDIKKLYNHIYFYLKQQQINNKVMHAEYSKTKIRVSRKNKKKIKMLETMHF